MLILCSSVPPSSSFPTVTIIHFLEIRDLRVWEYINYNRSATPPLLRRRHSAAFSRTVFGVAGPLVILDKVKVVSPEFTFYDSSKPSIDGSFSAEKLLRVRMDLSFMFASKENDTWVRALLKNLTVEAGSGL